MGKYCCERCGKIFSQKSHYASHQNRKTPCDNNISQIKTLVNKLVKDELNNLQSQQGPKPKLKVASMFCGCGGLDYAFHKLSNDFEVIYANDFDKDSCDSYEKYYKFKPVCEDIKQIADIPECDVLTGGFPCQGFSIANLHRTKTDERNELYKELVRLLKLKQPKYFVFENVKGIQSLGGYDSNKDKQKRQGKVFKMIVKDLENCGYSVHTKLFKLKWYDIPQNRERVIFLGLRKDIAKKINFNWPDETQQITKTLRDAIGDLPISYDSKIQHVGSKNKVNITGYMGNRKLDWDSISPTITGRGGGTGGPIINVHPSEERRMTVREYARIQTFPDDFHFSGSMSSMYRQIGNAVPPKFSFVLAKLLIDLDQQSI